MAYRLLNYMVEIWRKCESNHEKKKVFSLPKIIPCVLYTGKRKWTSPIEFKTLYEDVEGNEDYLVNFKYILIDVHRYKSADLLKMSSMLSSAFYMEKSEKNTFEKRLIELIESLKFADKKETQIFIRWLTSAFTIDEEKQKVIEEKIIKGEEPMSNLARIARSFYNDGKAEGEKFGEERGIKKGKIIGISEEKISSIKRLLSYKLKNNLNSECMKVIDNVPISKLEEIERKIFEINSWKEVEEILGK